MVTRLNSAINQALQTPEAQVAFKRIGAEVRPASLQDFGLFLAGERIQWADVMRRSGLTPN